MPPQSMVDALLKARTFLKPNGRLIDIHPQSIALPLYVTLDNMKQQVGTIKVISKINKYQQADEAVATVLQMGTFTLVDQQIVDYYVYFDTVDACRHYLKEEWSDANLAKESWQQMTQLMSASTTNKQLHYSEGVKFNALIPNLSNNHN